MNNIYVEKIKETALNNKYTLIYINLIQKSIEKYDMTKTFYNKRKYFKKFYDYCEAHHIFPVCLCNSKEDTKNTLNIVFLTAREHFLCHWLLTKMFENEIYKNKLKSAFAKMTHEPSNNSHRHINSKYYEYCKKARHESASYFFKIRQKNNGLTKNKTKFINIKTNEIKLFEKNFNDPEWITFNTNKIVALNTLTNEKILISKEEFYNNPIFVGHTKGKVYLINNETGVGEYLDKNNYDKNKYHSPSSGKKWKHTEESKNKIKENITFKAKDINGNIFNVTNKDIRYLSGELGKISSKKFIINGKETVNIKKSHKHIKNKFLNRVKYLKINDEINFFDDINYNIKRLY